MAGVEDMIAEMEKCLGVGETNGNNRNYITAWYGMNGQPWCDMTVTYAAWHSGNQSPVCFGGKYAYTVAHAQAFKDRGLWHVGASGIRRGDIVFFDWNFTNQLGAIDHVGVVTGTSGTAVLTIEGNIENACRRKVRYEDTIAGYGRPNYVGVPSTPPPAPPGVPSPYVAFPGTAYFMDEPNSPIITAMGNRLVAEGCGRYSVGPGPQWGDADKASYAAWQRKCGYSGSDANGWPGKTSWDKLKVPK